MKYNIDRIKYKDDEVLIRIYIPLSQYVMSIQDTSQDKMFYNIQHNLLDPLLEIEEEKNNIALAIKVNKFQIGEERTDGNIEIAIFCSYIKFNVNEVHNKLGLVE